jgi:putative acetyltransferase
LTTSPPVVIRPAVLDDRPAIRDLHAASIRRLCSKSYSPAQIERWAGFLSADRYTAVITDEQRRFVVAEMGGRIVGFGQFHPAAAEIEAVYVDPEHAGSGVGSALLRHLERLGRESSLRSLHLTATLNAVPFYEHHGFQVIGHEELGHPSGAILECAAMTKALEGDS